MPSHQTLEHPRTDVESLRRMCAEHSRGTVVVPVESALPEWIHEDGRLRNTRTDYFSIGLYAQEDGRTILLMQQGRKAIIMLLVGTIDGRRSVLLSLRTEPGLIGLTNFSTTIQSTPSNYLRKHGGKSTPFIEIAMEPERHGQVLYDAFHHDWGEFYLGKTKRFLVVELASPVEAPAGFRWVPLASAKALLVEDHLVTTDLRVCLLHLTERPRRGSTARDAASDAADSALDSASDAADSAALRSLDVLPGVADDRGTTIRSFETRTTTREVERWVQPLLVPQGSLRIRLPFAQTASGRFYAIERRSQPGLRGAHLWFPADHSSAAATRGRIARSVTTSAEGGRFWRHEIVIELVELDDLRHIAGSSGGSACWVSEKNLARIVGHPLESSLELRVAWSLVYGGALDAP